MRQLKQSIQQRLADWLRDDLTAVPPQVLEMSTHGLALKLLWGGDKGLWRQRADGTVLQIDLRPGKLMNKADQPRLDTLCGLWLGHLAANAAGQSTTSLQSGTDGLLVLPALAAETAQGLISDLVEVYLQAWQSPLPLARKTGCAWLIARQFPNAKHSPTQVAQAAQTAARQAFEGGYRRIGERSTSASLQRAYPEFEDIWPGLSEWAQRVYGPLLQTVLTPSVVLA